VNNVSHGFPTPFFSPLLIKHTLIKSLLMQKVRCVSSSKLGHPHFNLKDQNPKYQRTAKVRTSRIPWTLLTIASGGQPEIDDFQPSTRVSGKVRAAFSKVTVTRPAKLEYPWMRRSAKGAGSQTRCPSCEGLRSRFRRISVDFIGYLGGPAAGDGFANGIHIVTCVRFHVFSGNSQPWKFLFLFREDSIPLQRIV